MLSGSVTNRYTRGLFAYAKAHGVVDQVDASLEALARALEEHPELKAFIEHPLVEAADKTALLKNVFGDQLDPVVLNFLHILFVRKRAEYVTAIYQRFHQLAQEAKGFVEVLVEAAASLSDEQVRHIERKLGEALHKQVKAEVQVVPGLIAGCRIRLGDRVIDATVRGALDQFSQRLLAKGVS
ncbi:MAG: ATP synthase F1 subunit delta [Alicyclobacillus sp.]|nr:ATP synthase F1 subunit delta [Alicyclobacillus sp.]